MMITRNRNAGSIHGSPLILRAFADFLFFITNVTSIEKGRLDACLEPVQQYQDGSNRGFPENREPLSTRKYGYQVSP